MMFVLSYCKLVNTELQGLNVRRISGWQIVTHKKTPHCSNSIKNNFLCLTRVCDKRMFCGDTDKAKLIVK